jgi:2-polyprenyl-3-methyl-5-hydroxy-6-metoxy-1,4-benzoquinol methylase
MLGKYQVNFFECTHCHALQTEQPYWLEEAYGEKNLSNLDTGAARRNIDNLAACYGIAKLFNAHNVLDIGGGDGLLCRLLRDYGINCYVQDKYATPTYAQGFTQPNFTHPDLVIGFEVLEHFANPQTDLEDLFGYQANTLLLSTALYTNQTNQWWYLLPESGQHVFFYNKQSLEWIAQKYGYSLIISGEFILFTKEDSVFKKGMVKLLLSKTMRRFLKSLVVLLPAPGIEKDQALQIEKSKQVQGSNTK